MNLVAVYCLIWEVELMQTNEVSRCPASESQNSGVKHELSGNQEDDKPT